jgi:hypothetical protein
MDPDMISALMGFAGGVGQGFGDYFANLNKAKAYGNAAQQASQESGVATSQALTAGDRAVAHAATSAAAGGGGFTGSTMAVLGDLAGQSMFRARAAAYRGATEVQADRYEQKLAKRAATLSLISGFTGGSMSLVGGWAKSQANARQTRAMASLRNPQIEAPATPVGAPVSDELAGLY